MRPLHPGTPAARILSGVVALAVLAAQSGCVRVPVRALPLPPSEETRSRFGRIGVTWEEGFPPILVTPAAGSCSGAARGALMGTLIGFVLAGQLMGGPSRKGDDAWAALVVLAVALAIIPVAVLIGSVYGAAAAHSPEEVDGAVASVMQAASDPVLQRGIAREVFESARKRTDENLAWMDPGGSRDAFDSILEVGPIDVALIGPYQINPPLRLEVALRVRMVRVSDGALLYEGTELGRGAEEAELFEWAENDGARVRSQLRIEGSRFAQRIVETVFLLHLLPVNRVWKRTGTP